MTAQNALSIFSFDSTTEIRTFTINGEPWFVALDVCNALGISNNRDALLKLDDDEKDTVGLTDSQPGMGPQSLSVISEPGLYTMILRCRDATKKGSIPYRFRKWVTGEVLPQIRRTGSYIKNSLPQEDRIKMVADQVANATASAVMQAMQIEQKNYSAPLKPGYRDMIHSPEGVVGLAERSLLMNLLNQMQDDGHDVSGAAAEFTTMISYIVGVSKCLRDIRTHAQYINSQAGEF